MNDQQQPPPDPYAAAGVQKPTIGRIVLYRSATGNYTCPAVVTATEDTLWPEGVARGDVPGLDSPLHVHLQVFTPGDLGAYTEHNVPNSGVAARTIDEQPPRSWAWPHFA
jgi:hypothetical protein